MIAVTIVRHSLQFSCSTHQTGINYFIRTQLSTGHVQEKIQMFSAQSSLKIFSDKTEFRVGWWGDGGYAHALVISVIYGLPK